MASDSGVFGPAKRVGKKFQNPEPTQIGGFRLMLKVLPEYFATRGERSPRVTPGPFRTDAGVYGTEPATGLRVTWFGHSASLLEMDGVRMLMDPVWEERASPWQWFGPKRFFPPTMGLEEMPALDAVLLSHDHYDHLGERTVRRLAGMECTREAVWLTSKGVGRDLRRWGVPAERLREMDWMDEVEVRSGRTGKCLRVREVPSRHFSGRSLWNRFETLWGAFVIGGERHRVFFGADSGWWEGFGEIGERFGPFDLTMLEIGAFNELWKEIHLGPDGAARAFRAMGGGGAEGKGMLMPIHWGLFDLALHAWRQPMERMEELAREGGMVLWSPEPGRPTEVVAGEGMVSGWWRRRE